MEMRYWLFDIEGYYLGSVDNLEDAKAFEIETGGYYEIPEEYLTKGSSKDV